MYINRPKNKVDRFRKEWVKAEVYTNKKVFFNNLILVAFTALLVSCQRPFVGNILKLDYKAHITG